jgi:hypothetical protein
MSVEPTYETQRIGRLGIVTGVWRKISLIEQIDAQVRASDRILRLNPSVNQHN